MLRLLTPLIVPWIAAVAQAAAPVVTHYLDDGTGRQAMLTEGDFGRITIVFRFTGGPGSYGRWYGEGTRKEKTITFWQTVAEDQVRGTSFVAKASESKLEVEFKPGERMPVDAGINGTFRHISDEKRLSLAKKEAALAEDALAQALKTVPRSWANEDRPVAAEWKARWPNLRNRWMSLVYKTPPPPAPTAAKPAPGKAPPLGAKGDAAGTPGPTAEYWSALSETTGMGLAFINQPLDKLIPNWDGEYDDGFGGHVSLRLGTDGFLRFTLSCTRGSGDGQTGELIGRIPASAVTREKNGELNASYTHKDAVLKPEEQQAMVKLRKQGHFLTVETQYAERYYGRAWFNGIYRWAPVPKE